MNAPNLSGEGGGGGTATAGYPAFFENAAANNAAGEGTQVHPNPMMNAAAAWMQSQQQANPQANPGECA